MELQERIKRVLALADLATPGPWVCGNGDWMPINHVKPKSPATGCTVGYAPLADCKGDKRVGRANENAAFIAEAHEMAAIIRALSDAPNT